jgi:hypothetical protein
MAVKILAFALVTEQTMAGTKGKATHDTEGHERFASEFAMKVGTTCKLPYAAVQPQHWELLYLDRRLSEGAESWQTDFASYRIGLDRHA